MRLICPNCDAQYEVSDDAIPHGGRDVQCSNCGHAWFQYPPEIEAAMEAEQALFDAPDDAAPPEAAPEAAAPHPDAASHEKHAAAHRRTLDDSVLAVLREEAEREAIARRTEAPRPLEQQPDLGLDAAGAAPISPAARRVAQMKGIDPDAAPPAAARPVTRAELFPDIEEINSTLRASSDRRQDSEVDQALRDLKRPRRTGFRSGFVLMMILAVVAVLAYVMAPRIAEQIPDAAGAMAGYVAKVDGARLWLDGMMQQAIGALRGTSGT